MKELLSIRHIVLVVSWLVVPFLLFGRAIPKDDLYDYNTLCDLVIELDKGYNQDEAINLDYNYYYHYGVGILKDGDGGGCCGEYGLGIDLMVAQVENKTYNKKYIIVIDRINKSAFRIEGFEHDDILSLIDYVRDNGDFKYAKKRDKALEFIESLFSFCERETNGNISINDIHQKYKNMTKKWKQ